MFTGCEWKGSWGACQITTTIATTTSSSTSSLTSTITTPPRPEECEDLTAKKYSGDYVIMEPEFWKCSNENQKGSVCKLQCAIHGLQLVNKATSKVSGSNLFIFRLLR